MRQRLRRSWQIVAGFAVVVAVVAPLIGGTVVVKGYADDHLAALEQWPIADLWWLDFGSAVISFAGFGWLLGTGLAAAGRYRRRQRARGSLLGRLAGLLALAAVVVITYASGAIGFAFAEPRRGCHAGDPFPCTLIAVHPGLESAGTLGLILGVAAAASLAMLGTKITKHDRN